MDERLLPRKVPEPTRFPSVIFEPCVPDASLVFGCGVFEAPKTPAEVTKTPVEVMRTPHETRSTKDFLQSNIQENAVPSWIKAYGVEKKVVVDNCDAGQSDHMCIAARDSGRRRPGSEAFERSSGENFSGNTDWSLGGAGTVHLGEGTVGGTLEALRVGYEKLATEDWETQKKSEMFGMRVADNFSGDTGPGLSAEKYRYGPEESNVASLQNRGEISDCRPPERQGRIPPVQRQSGEDVRGRTTRPESDLPDPSGIQRAATAPVAAWREIGDLADGGSFRYTDLSDRIPLGDTREVASPVSDPRPAQTLDFQREGEKFPEPQKGFISSDCSLSDYTHRDSRNCKGKWKNVPAKENKLGPFAHEKVWRAAKDRVPLSPGLTGSRLSPGRAEKRKSRRPPGAVSDPLVGVLFHLQNRHTELLLQLAADVADVALKQRRMFDVFQRLQNAFCDVDAAPAARTRVRRRRCDKCTQTVRSGGEQATTSTVDASTQSDADGGTAPAECPPVVVLRAAAGSGASLEAPKEFGTVPCATHKEAGRPAESGANIASSPKVTASRWKAATTESDVGSGAVASSEGTAAVDPRDVRRLIAVVRSVAARVKDSREKTGCPSHEVDPDTGTRETGCSREVEVGGLIAAMRSAVSRYKNSDFIKAPNLEDVVEASEDTSDSEDGEVSEAGDESLTIGDLSLVPQNVSPTPDPSLQIDSRGLDISSDVIASGSDDSDTERSTHCSRESRGHSENADTTAVYLYRNIFNKVQEILEHNKTTSENQRDSCRKKPSAHEAETGRTGTGSH